MSSEYIAQGVLGGQESLWWRNCFDVILLLVWAVGFFLFSLSLDGFPKQDDRCYMH